MNTEQRGATELVHLADEAAIDTSLSADAFRAAFRGHAAGVAVITAEGADGPAGMTATSVFSVSATPPLLVFSVSDLSSATPTIVAAASVVVHLLGADQVDLAKLCATSGVDRFADTSMWKRLPTGEPYFPSAHTWVRGVVVNTLVAGSSTLIVVNATHTGSGTAASGGDAPESENASSARPLVYHNRTWHELGSHSRLG
ncbi:flavin reductase family protein [Microbacterium sp. BR1]|uniref:flavin reductase family protein n=1 Tax=Microbacterium sp. BR1 TaxID=1070896 RepID=UPI000C2C91BA|nr:flavin reductase family protein [Microbacterium sp. BR1]